MKKISPYNFKTVEKKWQKKWLKDRIFQPNLDQAKKPFYNLMMFPYPSAEGLHVGGIYTFSGVDTYGRYKKLQGYDVFQPIGLDGFGIHSENYAMKIGQHILDVSKRTEKNFYRQLHEIGNMFDWSRTVETYKPEYYKWTQWIFLKMYEKGLAYRKLAKVNWCPSCKTVLSDEQVIGERCERCDSLVEKKELAQWFFKITDYAERLLKNLDWIDWPEDVKTNQRNWIGKSEGAKIKFRVQKSKVKSASQKLKTEEAVEVFTTRPDTLFGATYLVVAPEHPLIKNYESLLRQGSGGQVGITNYEEVKKYVAASVKRSEQERKDATKEKTGVELKGVTALNPATKKEIPIWVADYVLGGYGTGAIMAVPAHDERDFEFAKKYKLPIIEVVKNSQEKKDKGSCFSGEGVAVNSGFINGLTTEKAKKEIIKWLQKNKIGQKSVDYKLRDWCISRQRYWGPPIPVVWCQGKCKVQSARRRTKLKVKVLMIHGFEGSGKGNWFPWMKQELEKFGCEVYAPTMKTSKQPKLSEWMKELKPSLAKLDENSLIIAHSLGSKAALHLLERNNKKVAKLFLVASALGNPKRDWKWLQNKWKGSDVDSLKKFWEEKLDWQKADEKAAKKYIIISQNDNFIDPEHYKVAKLSNVEIEKWANQGHITQVKNEKLKNYVVEKILQDIDPVAVPVAEKDLPVNLPPMEDFLPEGKGKGPLAKNEKFVHTTCPVCGGPAERETDVSDPFVDSAWYFFRYPSTEFENQPFDKKRTKKWLPVDSYIGGKEHTVLHLLYSRFVTMVFKDLGLIDFEEPYKRFFGHGLITKDGAKMSKSKGNVINPDEMIAKYGADSVRLYLRFLGDFSQGGDWRDTGIEGMHRFIQKLWRLFFELEGNGPGVVKTQMIDKTIKVVGEDLDRLSFNTAVARLMEFINWVKEQQTGFNQAQAQKIKETLAFLLAPMAPHLAEEFWFQLEKKTSIFSERWPKYNPANIVDDEIELVVQVNGKVRDRIKVAKDIVEEEAKKIAQESERVRVHTVGKEIRKVIYIPGRLVSIVVG